ncbi:MAG: GGDEF domain-containing protein [Magnetococcales bacterium]|nr:GGDEF domain-containing protein [Magnetococcales bacterium]
MDDNGFRKILFEIKKLDNKVSTALSGFEKLAKREKRLRKRIKQDLYHTEKMVQVIANCQNSLSMSASEAQYLNHVCESTVRSGGYPLVWIGLLHQDEEDTRVYPAASAGIGKEYLENLSITWTETPSGNGPTGRAIRSGHPEHCHQIADDPAFVPWKEQAKRHGLVSSVAIPLIFQQKTFGAFNLYSSTANDFNADRVALLSRVAEHTAFGIYTLRENQMREQEEARLQKSHQSRHAIAKLLESSLEPVPLTRQLEMALHTILSIPWLSIESKGSIFLADENSRTLTLQAQHGLATPLLTQCHTISYGYCLCGRAAASQEVVFRSSVDAQHEVTFAGIKPHGHYCVPIMVQKRLLGVLNLYVEDGYKENPEERAFLTTVANTLAGIIERKSVEEEIARLARYDSLTGVFNRHSFQEHLQRSMAIARRKRQSIAILFLDLDQFKPINDHYGHATGDELLRQVSQRILDAVRATDVVSRFGGDEFCVLLLDIIQEEDVIAIGQKIIHSIAFPFILNNIECHVGVSIGAAIYPAHCNDTETLLKLADQSLYDVKRNGRNHILLHQPIHLQAQ